jgi:hypothetical protein
MLKKILLLGTFILIAAYAGAPMFLSAPKGLPYYHFWDEAQLASGALGGMQTNEIFPRERMELVYGGVIRYPLMVIDWTYYQYLKLIPNNGIKSKDDILTHRNGLYKTASHSGFYYWSRIFVILLNVLGFIFLFEIGRLRHGVINGLLLVLILSSVQVYYGEGFMVKPNLAIGTWMLGTILFAIKYHNSKKSNFLYLSFMFCGLATGTKMTGLFTLLIPFTVILFNRKEFEFRSWKHILKALSRYCLTSFAVYAVFNPTILVFPDRIYGMLRWQSWEYRVGNGHFSKTPGIEHLEFQIKSLASNFGNLFMWLAITGLILWLVHLALQKNMKGTVELLIILIFPVFTLLYFTSIYTIAYHRNFHFIYPILALLAAEPFFVSAYYIIKFFKRKAVDMIFLSLTTGFIVYSIQPGYTRNFKNGFAAYKSSDTRTQIIGELNELSATNTNTFIGFDKFLMMSPEDLRKLKAGYGFFNIEQIDSALLGFTHLVVAEYKSNVIINNFDSLNQILQETTGERRILKIEGYLREVRTPYSWLEWPVFDPAIVVLEGSQYPPPYQSQFILPIKSKSILDIVGEDVETAFKLQLLAGDYELKFEMRGDPGEEVFPIMNVILNSDTVKQLTATEDFRSHSHKFHLDAEKDMVIKFQMINDLYYPERGIDRNIFLKEIVLKPVYQ